MELWIRSQNKEILAKAENINIRSSCDEMPSLGVYYISIGNLEIAQYKTKERALEVLDEIQCHLVNMNDNKWFGVYEMPEE